MRIVVTGPPGSGKSTLSHALADELGLVLLVKDDLKQQLLARHPAGGVAESRRRGREAVRLLLDRARSVEAAVLDSVWVDRDGSRRELQALGGVVEVFCRCDVETMRRRYAARAGTRPAGWFDLDREDDERWPPEALEPLAGGLAGGRGRHHRSGRRDGSGPRAPVSVRRPRGPTPWGRSSVRRR